MVRVGVVGAGIQGACVALELASRGHRVDLFERDERPINRASRWNEGKIHLGFVYARDRSLETARTALRGAFSFWPLLGRWIDTSALEAGLSTPFIYGVHRESALDVDAVGAHLERVVAEARSVRERTGTTYLGDPGPFEVRRLTTRELGAHFSEELVIGAFQTAERSIDPGAVADALTAAIQAEARIELLLRTPVTAIRPLHDGRISVRFGGSDAESREYDSVVNASWEDRLRLDATAGLRTNRPRLFRYKVAVHCGSSRRQPKRVPSVTFVAGPFGDVVRFPGGRHYLSWYPSCMVGSSTELRPPDFGARLDPARRAAVRQETLAALEDLVPELGSVGLECGDDGVAGGFIVGWGATDIDDPASELHQRHDIGVHTAGRYHTIDTGKYGMAPVFAVTVADRVDRGEKGDR